MRCPQRSIRAVELVVKARAVAGLEAKVAFAQAVDLEWEDVKIHMIDGSLNGPLQIESNLIGKGVFRSTKAERDEQIRFADLRVSTRSIFLSSRRCGARPTP